jgi:dTDP-4-dehydrorhamnose reductase
MKLLVIGCNGMAGHMISMYLMSRGFEVEGFARRKGIIPNTIIGDCFNTDLLTSIIRDNNYDYVINCVGILNKSAETDKASASFINSYFPHYLEKLTDNSKTKIIQLSTDCVFSGKRGHYSEGDTPDGTTFYDRSKALGELINDKDLTVRSSIIGPDLKSEGIGLLNWFLKQSKPVHGYTNVIWTGQTTLQLAKSIEAAINNNIHGLYNLVPQSNITKYELLCLFDKYIRNEAIDIIPDDSVSSDKSLVRTNYQNFNYIVPDYITQIRELADWMHNNNSLYPHYNIK